jgi:murein DD-endopeptidase MepM/ murein hydrolase activator NlpD
MHKLLLMIVVFVCGCASTANGSFYPQLGLKFNDPYSSYVGGGLHTGIDIMVPVNTPVHSIADGKVSFTRTLNISPSAAPVIVIDHSNGISSYYHHIDSVNVSIGDIVKQGQIIAKTALTGAAGRHTNIPVSVPHLHLTITKGGVFSDPLALDIKCLSESPKFIWPVGCK